MTTTNIRMTAMNYSYELQVEIIAIKGSKES